MYRIHFVLLLLLTSIFTVQAQSTDTILFSENFSVNRHGWEVADSSTTFSDFVNGEYVIERDETDIGWFVTPGFTDLSLRPQFEPPYEVSVDITSMRAQNDYMCAGLYVGVNDDYSYNLSYVICNEGRWVASGTTGWRGGGMLDRCLPSPYNQTQRLTVQVWEDYHVVLLNGEIIGVTQAPDDFGRGSIGIIADVPSRDERTAYRATFDNLEVRALNAEDQPQDLAAQAFVPYDYRLSSFFVAENEDLAWFTPAGWNIYEYERGIYVLSSGFVTSGRFINGEPLQRGDVVMDLLSLPLPPDGNPEISVSTLAKTSIGTGNYPYAPFTVNDYTAIAITMSDTETDVVFTNGDQLFYGAVNTAANDFEYILPMLIPIFESMGEPDPLALLLSEEALPLTQTYTHDERDFSFAYPQGWFVEETYSVGPLNIYSQSCRQTRDTQPEMAYINLDYETISTYAPDLNPQDSTVEDVLQAHIDYMDAEYGSTGETFIEVITIDGVDVAFEVTTDSWMTVTTIISLTDDGYVGEWTLWNNEGEIQLFLPTVLAMAASLTSSSALSRDSELPRRYDSDSLDFSFNYPQDWELITEGTGRGLIVTNGIPQPSEHVEIRFDRYDLYDLNVTARQNRQLDITILSYIERRRLRGFETTPTPVTINGATAYRLDHRSLDDVVYAIPGNGFFNLYLHVSGGGIPANQDTINAILESVEYHDN